MREWLRNLIGKLFSSQKEISWRRALVMGTGTVLLITKHLPPEWWTALALAYVTGEVAEHAIKRKP